MVCNSAEKGNRVPARNITDFFCLVAQDGGRLRNYSIILQWHSTFLFASGLEIRDYGRRGSAALTMQHPSILKSWQ
jgi:hypothetical protein